MSTTTPANNKISMKIIYPIPYLPEIEGKHICTMFERKFLPRLQNGVLFLSAWIIWLRPVGCLLHKEPAETGNVPSLLVPGSVLPSSGHSVNLRWRHSLSYRPKVVWSSASALGGLQPSVTPAPRAATPLASEHLMQTQTSTHSCKNNSNGH